MKFGIVDARLVVFLKHTQVFRRTCCLHLQRTNKINHSLGSFWVGCPTSSSCSSLPSMTFLSFIPKLCLRRPSTPKFYSLIGKTCRSSPLQSYVETCETCSQMAAHTTRNACPGSRKPDNEFTDAVKWHVLLPTIRAVNIDGEIPRLRTSFALTKRQRLEARQTVTISLQIYFVILSALRMLCRTQLIPIRNVRGREVWYKMIPSENWYQQVAFRSRPTCIM